MEINKEHLTEEQIQVTQFCGTEPPFSGKLLNEKRNGIYKCAVCKEVLFDSSTKYESGSGWPSFFDAIEEKIKSKEDKTLGMVRTEILCKNCESHLGHVFPDGPKPTGNRYCVNSLSLEFYSNE
ncbi:peptide-methionine (R)-S-oxide reductase MsrB [bacterium]|jgi:peptide-methionine (R)-S-oxide reductase|nr:peptide-methionine (R)-S-oxide reductase MsrB [Candidatus Actinomarina sp.]MDA9681472.1 peptide-methionine (R)-S-oxide reductase MsrB [bacterium]MDB4249682.1 peptide-methionine (R)-S-oxide reductase MsrB [Acidimicrobiia bacterium]MDC1071165.1 peptide-methionine (R)-S-oxide reductase MsrB [Acidimicrobiia bacterium]|tara:strand:+ start:12051 stop:12422 length:372 start_codon:yes stop_codon:yes gene_type:complete